jgi:DNA-binding MarR family transcriptional regulator
VERETSRDAVHRSLEELHRLTSSRRSYARIMANAGVELTRSSTEVLGHACRLGPLSMGALAAGLRYDPGATARLVAGLEDAGLLQRTRSDEDGRVNVVRATPAGEAVNARVVAAEADYLETALGDLDDAELATCAVTLERLVGYLHELEVSSVPRQRPASSDRSHSR